MEIWEHWIVQLGSVGMMVLGLAWVSIFMFKYIMKSLKDKETENKSLETEFRQYLQLKEKDYIEMIKDYSKNLQRFTSVIDTYFKKGCN